MMKTEEQRARFKRKIDALEQALFVLSQNHPCDIETIHRFADGIYIRELHAPAGTILTSVTHKTCHPFVLSKGVCDICDEYGDVTRYSAPVTGITTIGTRRVFLVHEDMVFTTFHRTHLTDPDEWLRQNTCLENDLLPAGFEPMGLIHRKEIMA